MEYNIEKIIEFVNRAMDEGIIVYNCFPNFIEVHKNERQKIRFVLKDKTERGEPEISIYNPYCGGYISFKVSKSDVNKFRVLLDEVEKYATHELESMLENYFKDKQPDNNID